MKKFTKIMLLIILILGLGGGVLFGAGLAAGGTIDMVCDGNHLADTRLFRILSHRFRNQEHRHDRWGGRLKEWDDEWTHWGEPLSEIEDIEDQEMPGIIEYPQEEVEMLSLDVDTGMVQIRPAKGNEIRVLSAGEEDSIDYYAEDKELYIEAEGYHAPGKAPIIEIPSGKKFRKLEVISDTAVIQTSGKLLAENTYMETDAGSVEVELLETKNCTAECSAGTLRVKFTGKLTDYAVYAESDSGNLSFGGKEYPGYQEGVFGNFQSEKNIDLSNDMGNMEIEFESKEK